MKYALLFIYTTICFSCMSQEQSITETAAPKESRLSIGLNFSTDYSDVSFKNNLKPANNPYHSYLERNMTYRMDYNAGVNFNYAISSKFSLESGMQYAKKGYAYDSDFLTFGDQIVDRRGLIYTDNRRITKLKIRYNHNYLDIPARIIYVTGVKRLKLISSIGITTNFRLNATRYSVFKYEDSKTSRNRSEIKDGLNPINFTGTVSAGVQYKYNDKIRFTAEPTYRHGIYETENIGSVGSYFWNAGLNFSCYYSL